MQREFGERNGIDLKSLKFVPQKNKLGKVSYSAFARDGQGNYYSYGGRLPESEEVASGTLIGPTIHHTKVNLEHHTVAVGDDGSIWSPTNPGIIGRIKYHLSSMPIDVEKQPGV